MKKKLRVLIADDDPNLRDLWEVYVVRAGHVVVAVTVDGGEALGIFEQRRDEIDLVITDYSMPRMSGTQLARGVHALRPDTPVILVTGTTPSRIVPQEHNLPILEKPVFFEDFKAAIEKVAGGSK